MCAQVSGLQLVHRLHSDRVPHDVRLADGRAGRPAISLRLLQCRRQALLHRHQHRQGKTRATSNQGCSHKKKWGTPETRLRQRFFYRAMLCIRGTSHGPVSVSVCVCLCLCLSVTSRSSTITAKRRITQTTPHDSPGTLVFWRQRSPRNSTGVTPYEGAKCRWGGSKSATFD